MSKDMNIYINFDFTDGTEISFVEGSRKMRGFTTNCLDFFASHKCMFGYDVIVRKKDGSYISAKELLAGDRYYTPKEIRVEHNIRNMLVAGTFNFKPPLTNHDNLSVWRKAMLNWLKRWAKESE